MDKKLVGLVAIFSLAFLFFLSVVLFNQPLSSLIRAKEDSIASPTNSLLFAWPLEGKADGTTQIKIDVFVRSETDKLISNKEVRVQSSLGEVTPPSAVSDKGGKASFVLTSGTAGTANLTATVDSAQLSKKLSIRFE